MVHFITWNVDPELFNIDIGTFNLAIRWYGLLFAMAFVFGYIIMKHIFSYEKVPEKLLDQLATYMIIATVIGARLGHTLFYEPDYYLSHPLEILKIWKGGLASHGAAIGIILALILFARKNKRSFWWVIDRVVIVVALGGVLIRTGNLMNSEIYGKPSELPWAFVFLRDNTVPRHPTQIYEALSYLLIFIYLYFHYKSTKGKPKPAFLTGMFLILVFAARFFIEFLKEPQVGFEQSMALNMGQLLSIPFVVAGLVMVLWPRKP